MSHTPLEKIPEWSPSHIAKAKEAWITSAEQVVALAATTGGIRSLSEQLNLSEEKTRELIKSAREVLSPTERDRLEEKVDTREFGLGVLPPIDDKTDDE
jgi:hypothetical protein